MNTDNPKDFHHPKKLFEDFGMDNLLLKHFKLGAAIIAVSILLLIIMIVFHEVRFGKIPEFAWGAILSIPITGLCMGIFSVIYEYNIRKVFSKSMRSMYSAWDTGVTVFPTHKHAPDRNEVLALSTKQVRIMSTTLYNYFHTVKHFLKEKIESGIEFKFIIYNPDSNAIIEKAREEGHIDQYFIDEIVSTCKHFLGPLTIKYPDKIKVKFCDFNTPFGITIIDKKVMVLSLNIYGLSRFKNETPCLIIKNNYDDDSVFKLYENSFDAIWKKLDNSIPERVRPYFS